MNLCIVIFKGHIDVIDYMLVVPGFIQYVIISCIFNFTQNTA